MYQTADHSSLRQTNRLAVLNLLYDHQTSSRSKLARDLRISKPAVADNLSLLFELGIVNEIDDGRTGATGCKPRLLAFNNDYRHIAAIDLHYGQPIFALANLRGEIRAQFTVRPPIDEGWLAFFRDGIARLLLESGCRADSLCRIAIAAPGIYRFADGIPYLHQQFPAWFAGGLIESLESDYGVSVLTHNDANAAAVGEYASGNTELGLHFAYLNCGLGVGAGLILNGELFTGLGNAAGELGNITDPVKLVGGATLETSISAGALLTRARNDLAQGVESMLSGQAITFDSLITAYRERDAYTLALLRGVGAELGAAASNLTNLLTLQSLVLGGEYDVFAELLIPEIEAVTSRFCHTPPLITVSKLGRRAGLLGMFALARRDLFEYIARLPSGEAQ